MALPPDLTTVVVTDTYSDLSGKPLGGAVTFTPTSQLADAAGNVVFVHQTVTATVSPATGTFSVTLPCTDNVLEPAGWAYVVQIGVPGIDGTAFTALFPSSLGASVKLRTVAPSVPPPPPLGTAVYSVNGQSGAVTLGAAQTGAVPLAGGVMTGPLILSADPALPLGAATKQYVDSHDGGGGGGGGGTVTSVSVVGTNGFAGTVANPSTNPALALQTTVTGLLIGNGTAVSAAVAGTDFEAPGAAAAAQANAESFATSAVAAEAARAEAAEALALPQAGGTVTGALTLSGTLQIPASAGSGKVLTSDGAGLAGWAAVTGGGSGSVTSVSVVGTNGFAGTVANATSTPALTLETTVTGLLKGNGTGVSAAVSGTDYDAAGAAAAAQTAAQSFATSAVATETSRAETAEALALAKSANLSDVTTRQTALNNLAGGVTNHSYLRGDGTNVQMSAIQAADVPPLNQSTTGSAASFTGSLAGDVSGTQGATVVAAIHGSAINPLPTGGSATTEFLRGDGSWQVPPGGSGGTVTVAGGGTGDVVLTPYAPLAGGTTSTAAVQQVTQGLGTAWGVLMSQGASALPVWGPPTLPDGTGGLWQLAVDATGALYTQPILQDEAYGVISDEVGNALV